MRADSWSVLVSRDSHLITYFWRNRGLADSCQLYVDGLSNSIQQQPSNVNTSQGRSQDFSKGGGGGHTGSYRGYSPDCHLNIVGCLLTKRLTKGGSRAPQDPPWLRPCKHTRVSFGLQVTSEPFKNFQTLSDTSQEGHLGRLELKC